MSWKPSAPDEQYAELDRHIEDILTVELRSLEVDILEKAISLLSVFVAGALIFSFTGASSLFSAFNSRFTELLTFSDYIAFAVNLGFPVLTILASSCFLVFVAIIMALVVGDFSSVTINAAQSVRWGRDNRGALSNNLPFSASYRTSLPQSTKTNIQWKYIHIRLTQTIMLLLFALLLVHQAISFLLDTDFDVLSFEAIVVLIFFGITLHFLLNNTRRPGIKLNGKKITGLYDSVHALADHDISPYSIVFKYIRDVKLFTILRRIMYLLVVFCAFCVSGWATGRQHFIDALLHAASLSHAEQADDYIMQISDPATVFDERDLIRVVDNGVLAFSEDRERIYFVNEYNFIKAVYSVKENIRGIEKINNYKTCPRAHIHPFLSRFFWSARELFTDEIKCDTVVELQKKVDERKARRAEANKI